MSEPTIRLVASKNVLMSQVSGESILLDAQHGVYFGLNAVGTHVWLKLQQGASLDDLVQSTVGLFDVTEQECESDIRKLLDDLLRHGLVEHELSASNNP